MATELWVTLGIALASALTFIAYNHPKAFAQNWVPVLSALVIVLFLLSLVHNFGIARAEMAANRAISAMPFVAEERAGAHKAVDAIDDVFIPMWVLLSLIGAYFVVTLLEQLPRMLNLNEPVVRSSAKDGDKSADPPKDPP